MFRFLINQRVKVMFPIGTKETILLDFIGSLGELEWLHYQSRIQDESIIDHFEKLIVLSIPHIPASVLKMNFLRLFYLWRMQLNYI